MRIARVELDKAQYSPGDDVHVAVSVLPGNEGGEGAESGDGGNGREGGAAARGPGPYAVYRVQGGDGRHTFRSSTAEDRPEQRGRAHPQVPSAAPTVTLVVKDLIDTVYSVETAVVPENWARTGSVSLTIPAAAFAGRLGWEKRGMKAKGFGAEISLAVGGRVVSTASTSFDVAEHWSFAPRYGFVCEYGPSDGEDILLDKWRTMKDFHLNVVQFYDWMYRHHGFIPPEPIFTDSMGRTIDMNSVKKQVQVARAFGMRPLAYGAAYAAEKDFADAHREWLAYSRDGRVHNLESLFFIMDISRGSAWSSQIVREFRRAMDDVGFSGIHVDQYGFPGTYHRATGEPVDTATAFAEFITLCRDRLGPDADIIFNCVNNWPLWQTAETPQNAVYIEVWPPHDTYRDLRDLVLEGRRASGFRKQVILAAYLSPFASERSDCSAGAAEDSMRLASAAIMASGGFHLVLGEGASALTGGYYPDCRRLAPGFASIVRRYWDFAVRYEEFLFDLDGRDVSRVATGTADGDLVMEGYPFGPGGRPGTLWTLVREGEGYKMLNLVNMLGIDDPFWNAPKGRPPQAVEGVKVRWLVDEDIRDVVFASPDGPDVSCIPLGFTVVVGPRGRMLEFQLPRVEYWSTVLVRFVSRQARRGVDDTTLSHAKCRPVYVDRHKFALLFSG